MNSVFMTVAARQCQQEAAAQRKHSLLLCVMDDGDCSSSAISSSSAKPNVPSRATNRSSCSVLCRLSPSRRMPSRSYTCAT